MRRTMTNKVISLVVAIAFLANDLCYGLGISPISTQAPKIATVQEKQLAMAFAQMTHGKELVEGINGFRPNPFSEGAPAEINGIKSVPVQKSEETKASFVDSFGGPISRRDLGTYIYKTSPSREIVFDEKVVKAWEHIESHDLSYEIIVGSADNATKETINLADCILQWLHDRIEGKVSRLHEVNDAMMLWFMTSYASPNDNIRYSNDALNKLLTDVLNIKETEKSDLRDTFPNIFNDFRDSAPQDKVFSDRAAVIEFIEKINYDFFSRPGITAVGYEPAPAQRPQAVFAEQTNTQTDNIIAIIRTNKGVVKFTISPGLLQRLAKEDETGKARVILERTGEIKKTLAALVEQFKNQTKYPYQDTVYNLVDSIIKLLGTKGIDGYRPSPYDNVSCLLITDMKLSEQAESVPLAVLICQNNWLKGEPLIGAIVDIEPLQGGKAVIDELKGNLTSGRDLLDKFVLEPGRTIKEKIVIVRDEKFSLFPDSEADPINDLGSGKVGQALTELAGNISSLTGSDKKKIAAFNKKITDKFGQGVLTVMLAQERSKDAWETCVIPLHGPAYLRYLIREIGNNTTIERIFCSESVKKTSSAERVAPKPAPQTQQLAEQKLTAKKPAQVTLKGTINAVYKLYLKWCLADNLKLDVESSLYKELAFKINNLAKMQDFLNLPLIGISDIKNGDIVILSDFQKGEHMIRVGPIKVGFEDAFSEYQIRRIGNESEFEKRPAGFEEEAGLTLGDLGNVRVLSLETALSKVEDSDVLDVIDAWRVKIEDLCSLLGYASESEWKKDDIIGNIQTIVNDFDTKNKVKLVPVPGREGFYIFFASAESETGVKTKICPIIIGVDFIRTEGGIVKHYVTGHDLITDIKVPQLRLLSQTDDVKAYIEQLNGTAKPFDVIYDSEKDKTNPAILIPPDVVIVTTNTREDMAKGAAGDIVAKGKSARVVSVSNIEAITNSIKSAEEFAKLIACGNLISVTSTGSKVLINNIYQALGMARTSLTHITALQNVTGKDVIVNAALTPSKPADRDMYTITKFKSFNFGDLVATIIRSENSPEAFKKIVEEFIKVELDISTVVEVLNRFMGGFAMGFHLIPPYNKDFTLEFVQNTIIEAVTEITKDKSEFLPDLKTFNGSDLVELIVSLTVQDNTTEAFKKIMNLYVEKRALGGLDRLKGALGVRESLSDKIDSDFTQKAIAEARRKILKSEQVQTFLKNKGNVFGLISLERLDHDTALDIVNVMIEAQKQGALYVPEIALRGTTDDVKRALEFIREIRKANPDAIIAAGSVSDSEGSLNAVKAGANIVITPGLVLEKTDIDEIRIYGAEPVLGVGSKEEALRAKAAGLKFAKVFPFRLKVNKDDPIENIQEALIKAFEAPLAKELREYLKFAKIGKTKGEEEATYANILKFVRAHPTEDKTFKLVSWGMDLVTDVQSVFTETAVTATGGANERDIVDRLTLAGGINLAKSVTTVKEARRITDLLMIAAKPKADVKQRIEKEPTVPAGEVTIGSSVGDVTIDTEAVQELRKKDTAAAKTINSMIEFINLTLLQDGNNDYFGDTDRGLWNFFGPKARLELDIKLQDTGEVPVFLGRLIVGSSSISKIIAVSIGNKPADVKIGIVTKLDESGNVINFIKNKLSSQKTMDESVSAAAIDEWKTLINDFTQQPGAQTEPAPVVKQPVRVITFEVGCNSEAGIVANKGDGTPFSDSSAMSAVAVDISGVESVDKQLGFEEQLNAITLENLKKIMVEFLAKPGIPKPASQLEKTDLDLVEWTVIGDNQGILLYVRTKEGNDPQMLRVVLMKDSKGTTVKCHLIKGPIHIQAFSKDQVKENEFKQYINKMPVVLQFSSPAEPKFTLQYDKSIQPAQDVTVGVSELCKVMKGKLARDNSISAKDFRRLADLWAKFIDSNFGDSETVNIADVEKALIDESSKIKNNSNALTVIIAALILIGVMTYRNYVIAIKLLYGPIPLIVGTAVLLTASAFFVKRPMENRADDYLRILARLKQAKSEIAAVPTEPVAAPTDFEDAVNAATEKLKSLRPGVLKTLADEARNYSPQKLVSYILGLYMGFEVLTEIVETNPANDRDALGKALESLKEYLNDSDMPDPNDRRLTLEYIEDQIVINALYGKIAGLTVAQFGGLAVKGFQSNEEFKKLGFKVEYLLSGDVSHTWKVEVVINPNTNEAKVKEYLIDGRLGSLVIKLRQDDSPAITDKPAAAEGAKERAAVDTEISAEQIAENVKMHLQQNAFDEVISIVKNLVSDYCGLKQQFTDTKSFIDGRDFLDAQLPVNISRVKVEAAVGAIKNMPTQWRVLASSNQFSSLPKQIRDTLAADFDLVEVSAEPPAGAGDNPADLMLTSDGKITGISSFSIKQVIETFVPEKDQKKVTKKVLEMINKLNSSDIPDHVRLMGDENNKEQPYLNLSFNAFIIAASEKDAKPAFRGAGYKLRRWLINPIIKRANPRAHDDVVDIMKAVAGASSIEEIKNPGYIMPVLSFLRALTADDDNYLLQFHAKLVGICRSGIVDNSQGEKWESLIKVMFRDYVLQLLASRSVLVVDYERGLEGTPGLGQIIDNIYRKPFCGKVGFHTGDIVLMGNPKELQRDDGSICELQQAFAEEVLVHFLHNRTKDPVSHFTINELSDMLVDAMRSHGGFKSNDIDAAREIAKMVKDAPTDKIPLNKNSRPLDLALPAGDKPGTGDKSSAEPGKPASAPQDKASGGISAATVARVFKMKSSDAVAHIMGEESGAALLTAMKEMLVTEEAKLPADKKDKIKPYWERFIKIVNAILTQLNTTDIADPAIKENFLKDLPIKKEPMILASKPQDVVSPEQPKVKTPARSGELTFADQVKVAKVLLGKYNIPEDLFKNHLQIDENLGIFTLDLTGIIDNTTREISDDNKNKVCGKITDEDVIQIGKLTCLKGLNLSGNESITNIEPLARLVNLESLFIANTGTTNIRAVRNMTKLKKFGISYTKVTDISPVEKLTNLETFYFSDTKVADISVVSYLSKLKSIAFIGAPIKDLSALVGLKDLTLVQISDNPPISEDQISKLFSGHPNPLVKESLFFRVEKTGADKSKTVLRYRDVMHKNAALEVDPKKVRKPADNKPRGGSVVEKGKNPHDVFMALAKFLLSQKSPITLNTIFAKYEETRGADIAKSTLREDIKAWGRLISVTIINPKKRNEAEAFELTEEGRREATAIEEKPINFDRDIVFLEGISARLMRILRGNNIHTIGQLQGVTSESLLQMAGITELSVRVIQGALSKINEQKKSAAGQALQVRLQEAAEKTKDIPLVKAIEDLEIPIELRSNVAQPVPEILPAEELQGIFGNINRLHGLQQSEQQERIERVEIFYSKRTGMTNMVKDVFRKINESHKKYLNDNNTGDVVKCRTYDNTSCLECMLTIPAAAGVRRVVIFDEEFGKTQEERDTKIDEFIQKFNDPKKCFKDTRFFNTQLRPNWDELKGENNKEKSFYQAELMMRALLIGLVDKDSSDLEKAVLVNMLDGFIEGKADEFVKNLIKEEGPGWTTVDKLKYFLGKTVSLLPQFRHQFEMMRLRIKTLYVAA